MAIKNKEPIEFACYLSDKKLILEEVVFIISAPDGTLVIDLNRQLPGKHLCLECKRSVIEAAIQQQVLEKFFGADIKIPSDFVEKIFTSLRKKALEMLCLARKSGSLTYGFEKVMQAMKAKEADFIIQACDAAKGGKEKTGLNAGAISIFSVFTSLELGKVIGRKKIVHMAILKGNANISKNLIILITRIQNF